MDKVFSVYAAAEDSIRERCTTLSLPTMPYELMDVLSKINVFEQVYDITQEYLVSIESA